MYGEQLVGFAGAWQVLLTSLACRRAGLAPRIRRGGPPAKQAQQASYRSSHSGRRFWMIVHVVLYQFLGLGDPRT